MRKCLFFLSVVSVFLFSACKQYKASLEEYLSYWSSQAYISSMQIDSNVLIDEQGFSSISSEADLSVTLTLQNPKEFEFIMPSAGEPRQIVSFSQPEGAGLSDYSLSQIDGNTLKLNLKSDFLKKHEWGKEISPTITLYSTDGRKFNKTYDFTLRVNTPPPSPKAVLAKSSDNYYVLCLKVPDMEKKVGDTLLHKDLSKIVIGDNSYNFSVNDTQNGFTPPPHSFINASDTVKLDGGEEVPTGNWVLYYKTSVQVGGEKISYKILLKDSKGLTSSEITVGTPLNKASPVKLKYGDDTIPENTNKDNPYKIGAGENEIITLIAESDTPGAKINLKKTKLSDGPEEISGGTSPFDIKLRREGSTEPTYKLVLYATANNFADSEVRTYYIKLTNAVTINGSEGNAWKKLKEAVANAADGATITIKGEIKATNDSGNNGQIEISKKLTIRGIGGNAVLDAGGRSRIFNVMEKGTTKKGELTLETLTLQNGTAGSGASGGGILVNSATTLAMTNVTIKDCSFQGGTSGTKGGGIYSSGTVTMQDSTIQGCSAQEGGGVFVNTGGTFTMTGGSIQGCTASKNGGGVFVGKNTTFHLKDGSIKNNNLTAPYGKGKGVYVEDSGGAYGIQDGNFIMGGSSVVGTWTNDALTDGNDVYLSFENSSTGTLVSLRIDSDNPLKSEKAACITPEEYGAGDGYTAIRMSDGSNVGAHVSKFTVTPNGTENWTINEQGQLEKP